MSVAPLALYRPLPKRGVPVFGRNRLQTGWSQLIVPRRELSPEFVKGTEAVLGRLPEPILNGLMKRGVKLALVPDIFAGLQGLTRFLVKRADKQLRRQDDTFRAIYLPLTNRIVIPEYTLAGKPSEVPVRIPNAQARQFDFLVLHEVGHAVDYCLGHPKLNWPVVKHLFPTFSQQPGFLEAYEKDLAHQAEPLPHGVSTPAETFATLFAAHFLPVEASGGLLDQFPNVASYLRAEVLPELLSHVS